MDAEVYRGAGVYIVTLNNDVPISVNADRPHIAERCIKVTRENCKFGKALNLSTRRANYFKTFGQENANFFPIAAIDAPHLIERLLTNRLLPHRIRGASGRLNEWLFGISPPAVESALLEALVASGLSYRILGSVASD